MKYKNVFLSLVLAFYVNGVYAGEHAGKEHAGEEHAGEEHVGKEHAGEEVKTFSAKQIKMALLNYLKKESKGGVFTFVDKDDQNKELKLKFVKIHDPVRKIEGKGYFACTDFRTLNGPKQKLYDLDFWINPKDDALEVTQVKVHKHPEEVNRKWIKKARYTFKDDEVVIIK